MGIWEKSGMVEIRKSQFEVSEEEFSRTMARTLA
jgi:hypothetical protein